MNEGERLATLEARDNELFRKLEAQDTTLESIRTDVHAIKVQLSGYRGFVAGAFFVVGSLGGLIGAAVTAAWHKLSG